MGPIPKFDFHLDEPHEKVSDGVGYVADTVADVARSAIRALGGADVLAARRPGESPLIDVLRSAHDLLSEKNVNTAAHVVRVGIRDMSTVIGTGLQELSTWIAGVSAERREANERRASARPPKNDDTPSDRRSPIPLLPLSGPTTAAAPTPRAGPTPWNDPFAAHRGYEFRPQDAANDNHEAPIV